MSDGTNHRPVGRWQAGVWLAPSILLSIAIGREMDWQSIVVCAALLIIFILAAALIAHHSPLSRSGTARTATRWQVLGSLSIGALLASRVLVHETRWRSSLISLAVLLAFGVAAALIEGRTRRPLRSYGRLALISAALLGLLVTIPTDNRDRLLAAIMWAGMTLLGLIWTIYYEASEPRR